MVDVSAVLPHEPEPVSLPVEILQGDGLLHAEVFSLEQLIRHGGRLGLWHRIDRGRGSNPLLRRLRDNATCLQEVFLLLRSAGHAVVPAGEWLLDNQHLVEEQLATARLHLPRRYSTGLPRLTVGDPAGSPRVYALALELVSHTDSRVDQDTLLAFIQAYQAVAPLTLGELWAVPTMLRLALLENLRRIAMRVATTEAQRRSADQWSNRLVRAAEDDPSTLVVILGELAREEVGNAGFVGELHRRLQGQHPALALVLQWLEQRLSLVHLTIADLIRTDHQAQAADQLAVANTISSLRRMGAIDWRDFVEGLSPVEQLLRRDPSGIYPTMDFATRDRYRHVIEQLARRCRPAGASAEAMIAEVVLDLCRGSDGQADVPDTHVGWWLIDEGRTRLETQLALRCRLRHPGSGGTAKVPLAMLLLPLACVTAIGVAAIGWVGGLGLGLLAFIPLSQAAQALINRLAVGMVLPQRLPRLALVHGVPSQLATMIAVPTMLLPRTDIAALVADLLVRQCANRDEGLSFALLTDVGDAAQAVMPGDEALVATATAAIADLNQTYGERFLLIHRPRQWNAAEGVWMGRERKRGKLDDLNQLLMFGDRGAFSHIVGPPERLTGIRYVIVLDTDTRLPRAAACDLVATLAHPLNRARRDPASGLIRGGHGLLQPRVAIGLTSARRSWYARLSAGDAGIDPYTRAVSDVYQDLFHEGSYIGKGIYDMAAFTATMRGRLPDNAVLSHDLIEGSHVRSALASDILLIEDHPMRYLADCARRRRWVRGDWQLLPWLGSTVPTLAGRIPNPLDGLARWKLFDNLRRSLVGPVTMALLITTWMAADRQAAELVTWMLLGAWLLPTALGLLALVHRAADCRWTVHLLSVVTEALRGIATASYTLATLPYEAADTLDAIVRTLWRCRVSRCHLLEWRTAAAAEHQGGESLRGILVVMLSAPLCGIAAAGLAYLHPELAGFILPFAIAWFLAPFLAWRLSLPNRPRIPPLVAADRALVLRTARLTWSYFAEHSGGLAQPLPPDNVQDLPVAAIARRTSPTNIGLALLAELAGHDLGWQTSRQLVDRVGRILTATASLQHYRGHLLNWYDTTTQAALAPRYVSTVDSGNLAGYLLVLAAGLRELSQGLPSIARRLAGVKATLHCADLEAVQTLADRAETLAALKQTAHEFAERHPGAAGDWCRLAAVEAEAHIAELGADEAATIAIAAQALAVQATTMALAMEWEFLQDPRSQLFAIGWQVEEARVDRSSYELLGSESRLGSYVAVAAGGIAPAHWFRLGRQQVRCAGGEALISWTGTMFEYLMPGLVMPEDEGTLLDDSNRAAVSEQRRWATLHGVPWGISESAYHRTDAQLNWQYRAFGVPGLGIKRGLADDLVIAPYATALALLIEPAAAVVNFRRMAALGAEGRYGFCEAIDFTPARLPIGSTYAVIRSWMAHHQGMSLLACLHVLDGAPMRRRFLADPRLKAHRLLLQERPVHGRGRAPAGPEEVVTTRVLAERGLRVITEPHPIAPEIHLLSNGRWHLLVTAAGAGLSQWQGLAINRWRADPACPTGGAFLYLRDAESGRLWSTTFHPVGAPAETYEAIFTQARAEFRRLDGGIGCHTEIAISPEDDVEVRRLTLTNHTRAAVQLELTSALEPILTAVQAEVSHPAFVNLFVETELIADIDALIAARRPRLPDEPRRCLIHLLVVRTGETIGGVSWETDRRAFLGRGGSSELPQALTGPVGTALGGGLGPVIDPILALRRQVLVPAGGRVVVDVIYAAANERVGAIALGQRYRDKHLADRVFGLSWTHGQVVLAQLGVSEAEAQVFGRLAGALVLATPHHRDPVAMLRNRRTRSGLWSHGISGDLPLLLLRVTDGQRLELVSQMLRAHAWWRGCGLAVDLVILIEDPSLYRQELTERVVGLVATGPATGQLDRPGGVFVRRADQVPEEDRHLLAATARVVMIDAGGTLAQFTARRTRQQRSPPRLVPPRPGRSDASTAVPGYDLQQWNGLGGFTRDGREYIIRLPPGVSTPLPWCNVLANPGFGSVISERGAAYTWSGNCHNYRLSTWHCDAVSDPHSEAFYLRDEDTGACWSPMPGPLARQSPRVVRHGFGYSVFMAGDQGIASELHVWVDAVEPLKHVRLRLVNRTARQRRLSAFAWIEWVLGEQRDRSASGILTQHDDGVLYARNPLNDEGPLQVAFLVADRRPASWTCDRREFLGAGGDAAHPAALGARRLAGGGGAGLDPCAALQLTLELDPGEEQVIVFTIGCGRDQAQASGLAAAHRGREASAISLQRVYTHWLDLLGQVQVKTGDDTLDLLANGWLAYQTMASRMLARSGFSQSGGAWGFRDQLQDAMALVHHDSALLRTQVLRCAGRQFLEGDVQHWWHPPLGRGVRTRISDDYLWLPLAVCRYVEATGDRAVLNEELPFLSGPPVPSGQESLYDIPAVSELSASLYQHARRAVLHGLRYGIHGLPLIGGGDWNDGFDRVGQHGRGESVWLGFFLVSVLRAFAPLARLMGEPELSERLLSEAAQLVVHLDRNAWEGDRYLRAWMDDGTALGSASGSACRIDALPQAWAALTGACDPQRSAIALATADRLLVRRDQGLIQLFDPPFDQQELDPGYIRGYVPGVRENGGQYTHAAVWLAMGFAAVGDGAKALELTRMLNPIHHGADPQRWQGEPYVVAADVYRCTGSIGRAGWTWYTGSAGWMLRLLLESLLGLQRRGDVLRLAPCLPHDFGTYHIRYRHGGSAWHLTVSGSGRNQRVLVDGELVVDGAIQLVDDGAEHMVIIHRT